MAKKDRDERDISLAELALTEEKEKVIVRIAEQFRDVLNYELTNNHIEAVDGLGAAARISASIIHQLQGLFNKHSGDPNFVDVEQEFQDMLTAYLTSYDMEKVAGEIKRMKNLEMN